MLEGRASTAPFVGCRLVECGGKASVDEEVKAAVVVVKPVGKGMDGCVDG